MNVSFLEKIISNTDVAEDSRPGLEPETINESTSVITTRTQIYRLLNRIFERHQLLTAELEHDDTQYSSMILEINEEEGYMVLDGFYPKIPAGIVAVKSGISAYTFLSGVEINFTSTIEAIADHTGEPYYKVPVPGKLLYFQKRQFLRVPVSMSNPIRIVLSDNRSLVSNGELRDLSVGGFSARLKLIEQRYSIGDHIPGCMLYMPGDCRIFCAVEIRQVEPATATAPPRIGARFLDMRNSDQKIVEKFIAETDRSLVRRFRN